jgi:hypothetical protein
MAKGLSLHLGLNRVDPKQYEGWDGALVACEADAKDMRRLAAARGFKPTILLTRKATAAAVIKTISAAAAQLSAGDIFFLTYSGHGGQVPDTNGDEKDDQDETWVLYDRELVDDELYALWAKFKQGVRILVLSDSCHSGTVTKLVSYRTITEGRGRGARPYGQDRPPRFRRMPLAVERQVNKKHKKLYDRIQKSHMGAEHQPVGASVFLISGCQDNQLSSDGDKNGLFTGTLLETWKAGKFRGGYRRFHREIGNRMPPWQSPNFYRVGAADLRFERQKPFTV